MIVRNHNVSLLDLKEIIVQFVLCVMQCIQAQGNAHL